MLSVEGSFMNILHNENKFCFDALWSSREREIASEKAFSRVFGFFEGVYSRVGKLLRALCSCE